MEGRSDTDLKIFYFETSMTTKKTVASDSCMDGEMQSRIMEHGVRNARRMLNIEPGDANFEGFATFPMDESTRAGDYQGEFYVSLMEKDKRMGFQEQLRQASSEYKMVHSQLVDLQLAESSKPEVTVPASSKKLEKEIAALKRKVISLTEEIAALKRKDISLTEEIAALKAENVTLKADNVAMKEQIGELQRKFNMESLTATRIRLRIALGVAHEKLSLELGRSPPAGVGWASFIDMITPVEMQQFGLTSNMLQLMRTGKKSLNKAAHEASLTSIAEAVTRVKKNPDSWREIFKYAYGEDADQVIFDIESDVDV